MPKQRERTVVELVVGTVIMVVIVFGCWWALRMAECYHGCPAQVSP